ncbi:CHAT domain-containing protein [Vararia minispora EC-137]|uniref:CHAT domain-containing protein n=1 Tax=Vararia minispora EC-137 TaxID=1314806 RepID=A0ACB8QAU4_9AGAM|nr:CHAT domain-containing protein [Vararia minispora EC-137]
MCLNLFGGALHARFDALGDDRDAEAALDVLRYAVFLTSDGNIHAGGYLNNFGHALHSRFVRFGELQDIHEAISTLRRAVAISHSDPPTKAMFLSSLGLSLQSRHDVLLGVEDLNGALAAHEEALQLTPDNHPSKAARLSAFVASLHHRFNLRNDIRIIDLAIRLQQQAIDLTPPNDVSLPTRLCSLGLALFRRFDRLKEISDIDASIAVLEQAVNACLETSPEKGPTMCNLANSFFYRYRRTFNSADADAAVQIYRRAVDLIPEGHIFRAGGLMGLGNALNQRFKSSKEPADLDEAADTLRKAILLLPEKHSKKPACTTNLAIVLQSRFIRSGERHDIDKAVDLLRQAISLVPPFHPERTALLFTLGESLRLQYYNRLITEDQALEIANIFLDAAKQDTGDVRVRIKALVYCSTIVDTLFPDFPAREGLYEMFFQLLPRLVWLGAKLRRRFDELSELRSSLSMLSSAVAFAISSGNLPLAVEWFEHGRGLVYGQILALRTQLDDLRTVNLELADELQEVSAQLASLSSSSDSELSITSSAAVLSYSAHSTQERQGQVHRQLADAYYSLVQKARSIAGFEDFLRPRRFNQLQNASRASPIILLNLTSDRCDALVLTPTRLAGADIVHVPLPLMNLSVAKNMRKALVTALQEYGISARGSVRSGARQIDNMRTVLRLLWQRIVQPILSAIEGILYDVATDSLPHVTWCAMGPLAFLPFHAAGIYAPNDSYSPKVFDFVISSYTPNLTALLKTSLQKIVPIVRPRVLVISQSATPGQAPLPGAAREVAVLERHFPDPIHLSGGSATRERVLQAMDDAEWIHFACHAVQNTEEPTHSAFLLQDSKLSLLDIMSRSFTHADFAVLSACQTATGSSLLPEEAVHLAAGMLIAGYRNVVGTMWSIIDEDGPTLTESLYATLNGDSRKTAYALHSAVGTLREKVGEDAFTRWVPFIHLGG